MKKKILLAVLASVICITAAGCGNKEINSLPSTEEQTTEAATAAPETEAVQEKESVADARFSWETIAENEIDSAIYEMTGGTWFYLGAEDEKSIDMDGLKGLTTYTAEAIPETEGYLRYLGTDPDGLHVFDVYDLYGRQYMVLTFLNDETFYIDDNEEDYYVKWEY